MEWIKTGLRLLRSLMASPISLTAAALGLIAILLSRLARIVRGAA